jgi:hypothetical protein
VQFHGLLSRERQFFWMVICCISAITHIGTQANVINIAGSGIMFKLAGPILLIVVSLIFLRNDIRERREDKAFRDHGESAKILPITDYTTYLHTKRKGFGEKKVTGVSYATELTFLTKSGEKITVPSRSLPPGMLENSQNGASVTIEYLPENPTTIRFVGALPYRAENRIGIYALLFGGVFWFYRKWRSK